MDFTRDGELFASKANGPHIIHIVLPKPVLRRGSIDAGVTFKAVADHSRIYPAFKHERHEYVQVSRRGHFTATAGAMFYTGGAWPETYRGDYFCSAPTVHLFHRDELSRRGVSYHATKPTPKKEFLTSTDLWFRPIHSRVGPNGSVYLLDFYNLAVSHNDVRLGGDMHGPSNAAIRPDRDHSHGRIWRIQHEDAKSVDVPDLADASGEKLLEGLKHPNRWVRMTAQRLLAHRRPDGVVGPLEKLVASPTGPLPTLHALWTLHRLDALSEATLRRGLESSAPAVQKNALRILVAREKPPAKPTERAVVDLVSGSTDSVRLWALAALRVYPTNDGVKSAVRKALQSANLTDRWSKAAASAFRK